MHVSCQDLCVFLPFISFAPPPFFSHPFLILCAHSSNSLFLADNPKKTSKERATQRLTIQSITEDDKLFHDGKEKKEEDWTIMDYARIATHNAMVKAYKKISSKNKPDSKFRRFANSTDKSMRRWVDAELSEYLDFLDQEWEERDQETVRRYKGSPHLFWLRVEEAEGEQDPFFQFQTMAVVARSYLSIQAMSAESEHVFSRAGRINTPLRSNLDAYKIKEMILFNSLSKLVATQPFLTI